MDRRDENLKALPKVGSISWLNGWHLGPAVMKRSFVVDNIVYLVTMAGFKGDLTDLYKVCIEATRAVEGDYHNLVNRELDPSQREFVLGDVVVSVT